MAHSRAARLCCGGPCTFLVAVKRRSIACGVYRYGAICREAQFAELELKAARGKKIFR